MRKKFFQSGFSLLELLVVIAIIGIMVTLSMFALDQARQSSRDARRKSDLETLRSGLEIYRSDCNDYPASLPSPGQPLRGDNTPTSCRNTNTYIARVPGDPQGNTAYAYRRLTITTYTLCVRLEQAPNPVGDTSNCGGCTGGACNYKVTGP